MGHEHHSHLPRNDYGKFIAVILTFCLLAVIGYALQHTISCFLLSWVIAYLLDPFLVRAENNGIKRIYALALLYVILGILTVFFLTFIVPAITINWNAFIRDLPLYIQKIKQLALEWKARLPDRYGSEEIDWLIEKATGKVDTAAEKTGNWFYGFGTSIFFNLFNIVLSPILVFFMLYYKQTVKDTISSWIPEHRRELILGIGEEVNSSIGGYLRGQVVVSIIVAILAIVALFIIDIPHPIFCGLFAGAASILPFIGVLLATLPALFFAWFKYQSIDVLGQTGIAFALIYFFEGYIIKPLVFKEAMNLNPLITIIMVMALGETLGFWGILLALPIASAIKITWGHFVHGDFKHH
ncbi:MAG: AI-2E family transporter [Geobacteraceae bacterium GWC2_55_20]|nr:MAG: AI-2E family transporter [Geobacteraceae bacterium GWC2_55_20]OGU22609.1 MAG: AI-2E family transporter [Geobacteraceae bacterium GWF2_54_21]